MIREIIRPQTNQVIIHIPQDMVDKELELIKKKRRALGTKNLWMSWQEKYVKIWTLNL